MTIQISKVCIVLIFSCAILSAQDKSALPKLTAKSALTVDVKTGAVLFSKNVDEKRSVASTQKLLTGLIIAESGDLDNMVMVEKTEGMVTPRNLWITAGSRYEKGKLLEVMLVRSYNDVAKCLARDHSASQGNFAKVIQAKAIELGMKNSVFKTAHGLTVEGQHSTASDMMILARACWVNPEIRKIVGTKKTTFTYQGGKTIEIENSNELIHSYAECVGMKTGYTESAGCCLIAAAKRGDKEVLAVILGSSWEGVWTDAELVLKWSLNQ